MTEKVLPEVEFIKAWQHYRVGQKIRPDSAMWRNQLIQWGFVKLVEPEPAPVVPEPVLELPQKEYQPPNGNQNKKHRDGQNVTHDHVGTSSGAAVDG